MSIANAPTTTGEFFDVIRQLRALDLAAVMAELGTSDEDTALWRLASDIKDALELHDQLTGDL